MRSTIILMENIRLIGQFLILSIVYWCVGGAMDCSLEEDSESDCYQYSWRGVSPSLFHWFWVEWQGGLGSVALVGNQSRDGDIKSFTSLKAWATCSVAPPIKTERDWNSSVVWVTLPAAGGEIAVFNQSNYTRHMCEFSVWFCAEILFSKQSKLKSSDPVFKFIKAEIKNSCRKS